MVAALGYLSQMVMGTGFAATGLACTPAASGLGVTIGIGALCQLETLAPVAAGSMATDSTPCVQQGINLTSTTVTLNGAGTWTIYGGASVLPGGSAVLPYYNAANPSQTWSGPNNNGQTNYTQIQARVALAATTGTVPQGSVALYTVTVPSGATAVTQAMIAQAAGGPFYLTIPQICALLNLPKQLGVPGYEVHVSGVVEQWGQATSGTNGFTTITFPIPFPNTCYDLQVCEINADGAWVGNGQVGTPTVHGQAMPPTGTQGYVYSMQWNAGTTTWVGTAGRGFTWRAKGN